MCTHAPQFHQRHDVKIAASLLCQDLPRYTDVKQRQFDVSRLRFYAATSKRRHFDVIGYHWANKITFYFIPSSEFNAYLKQIKVILSAVKKYRIFSLVKKTIFIFSL